ncbi:MAG TPA: glycerophosphodiester phosphodiesterase family protein [Anaeromyxobacteraceae bacterium]|nr:glycerophosphodiester phosphodiesterase family protein [Anaeromyxobacteraceae bacterium]
MNSSDFPTVPGRPLVLGHRGASAEAPENTLASFARALDQGADGFELDVWRCATGEAVVVHDEDLVRTGQSPLRVKDAPLAALRELDVGRWRGEAFRGERVPTLPEVLEAFPRAVVNVEMKSGRIPDPGLAVEVTRAIRQAGAEGRVVVSSFSGTLLGAFRSIAADVATGFLVESGPLAALRAGAILRALRPRAIHAPRESATDERIQAWKGAGLRVLVWTVDDPAEAERLARRGVDAIVSNRPGVVREAVRRVTGN